MDIFNAICEATKEANSFENHPVKALSLEEQILYLNGIALVMNADGNIDENQKEYVRILIKSFELDESCLNDMVAFAQAPDKDTIQAFFRTFRRRTIAQLLLFDAYAVSHRDDQLHEKEIAVIDKMAEQLEVLKGTKRDIFDLFCHIKHKDWKESALYFSSHLLNPEHFKHLLDYYEVSLDDVMKRAEKSLHSRLIERVLKNGMPEWIPLEYSTESFYMRPIEKEITSNFVDLSFTYGMIIPFLQSMVDRGELRVFGNNVYLEDNEDEILLLELNSDITYEQINKTFSIKSNFEDRVCDIATKELIRHYFNYINLGINIDTIGKLAVSNYLYHAPYNSERNAIRGEILVTDYERLIEHHGEFFSLPDREVYNNEVDRCEKIEMSIVEILTSGRVRFMR